MDLASEKCAGDVACRCCGLVRAVPAFAGLLRRGVICGRSGTLSLSRTCCFGRKKQIADDKADDQRDQEDGPVDFEEFHAPQILFFHWFARRRARQYKPAPCQSRSRPGQAAGLRSPRESSRGLLSCGSDAGSQRTSRTPGVSSRMRTSSARWKSSAGPLRTSRRESGPRCSCAWIIGVHNSRGSGAHALRPRCASRSPAPSGPCHKAVKPTVGSDARASGSSGRLMRCAPIRASRCRGGGSRRRNRSHQSPDRRGPALLRASGRVR